jgi:hypothetical protein
MTENAPAASRAAVPQATQAVNAWGRLRPDLARPCRVEYVQGKKERKVIYRLAGAGTGGSSVIAKRCRVTKMRIEQAVYEEVLPHLSVPSLRCHGWVEEPDDQFAWLFLEDAGEDQYSASLPEHRRLAGGWLGTLHVTAARVAPAERLPDRGPAYFLGQVRSARDRILLHLANPALTADYRALLSALVTRGEELEACWRRVEEACAGMPRTLVHGDFVGKNLRLRTGTAGRSLLVFDWAQTGWGVPAVDLTQAPLSSPGFGASPDLDAYAAAVREHWPGCGMATVRRWAIVATLFRSLTALNWEADNLKHEWAGESMARMRFYGDAIAGVVQAAEWKH